MRDLPAIWTDARIAELTARQGREDLHPYTCGNDRSDDAHVADALARDVERGLLIPTPQGWLCPACMYRQFWSHETGGPTHG